MVRRNTVVPPLLSGLFRDLYTFNQDKIKSYQLGTEEPPATMSGKNLFTASADDILSRMGKVHATEFTLTIVGTIMCIIV